MRGVEHQPEAATRGEDREQCLQAGGGVRQMVQNAAAVDVVEGAKTGRREVEQAAPLEIDLQAACLGTGACDGLGSCRAVEVGNTTRPPIACHMLGEHDGAVAGAAAGKKRTQRRATGASPGEHPVVDLSQMRWTADDEALRLVAGVARRVWIGFVLVSEP